LLPLLQQQCPAVLMAGTHDGWCLEPVPELQLQGAYQHLRWLAQVAALAAASLLAMLQLHCC
jgi:hypothetical protein